MKKTIALTLIVVMLMSLSACFGKKKSTDEINVYFKNIATNELEAARIKYSGAQSTVDIAIFAMERLQAGPNNEKYARTIPQNAVFLDVVVKDELATVNFSKEFTEFVGIDELLARFSVVRTLCDIPGITSVLITIDGQPLISNSTGKEIGVISKKDIVVDIETVDETEATDIKLYFATADATALKVEQRKVDTQDSTSLEKTIINELIKGPSSPELCAVIPNGTKILSIETDAKTGTCYVNFSKEFVSGFAGGTGTITVYSVVNSLCSLDNVDNVQILIEGEKGAQFGNYVFNEPIEDDMSIVQTN